MVSVRICAECRRMKQKCEPEKRAWDPDGVKVKCGRCIRYGRPCGPPEYRPQRQCERNSNDKRIQKARETARLSCQELGDFMPETPSTPGCITVLIDDKLELRRRLKNVDLRMETLKELHSAIEYLEISSIQNEMHYAKLLALKYASVRELWLMLAPVESLADRVAAAGNLEAAESAYSRVLDAYGALDTESFHEVRGLRLKMADFYIKMDAPICAERLLWEALDLRESPARAHKSDLEVLKRLARSLPQTSHDLSTVFESSVVEPTSCNSSPFPPLHRMIGSEYASKVEGNIFQTGPVLERYWPQNSLVGGMEAVMEVLQEFSYSDLETRDIHGRSPLYLASLLQKEAIGCALMTRASECEGMARRMTNARDVSGQTVLGIGILNGCSLSFIKALIENGAELDPEPLMPSPLTPLQAASWLGLSETVDLLLDHGAEVDRVFPGNKTAEILALEGGHNEIAERISNIFSETSISHSLEIDFTCPLSPYIPYVTIQSDNIY